MKRLFVFGCSFTNFWWPTWADFLSLSYDEYYNYGKSGGGNRFILESVIEADVTHKFTPRDTVVIMWSTHHRHDFYKDHQWHTKGNILNAMPTFDEEYIKKYFDIKGSVLHTLNYIYAAQNLLADKTNWHMTSMPTLTDPMPGSLLAEYLPWFGNKSLFEEFPEFKKYESIFEDSHWLCISMKKFMERYDFNDYHWSQVDFNYEWGHMHEDASKPYQDDHPSPIMHIEWLREVGLPINEPKAQELLGMWRKKWRAKTPVHFKEGREWCKKNIPHQIR